MLGQGGCKLGMGRGKGEWGRRTSWSRRSSCRVLGALATWLRRASTSPRRADSSPSRPCRWACVLDRAACRLALPSRSLCSSDASAGDPPGAWGGCLHGRSKISYGLWLVNLESMFCTRFEMRFIPGVLCARVLIVLGWSRAMLCSQPRIWWQTLLKGYSSETFGHKVANQVVLKSMAPHVPGILPAAGDAIPSPTESRFKTGHG